MKIKILLSVASITLLFSSAFSQSNPTPFNLSSGNYSFTEWDSLSAAGTYPANAKLHIHSTADPALADEPTGDWLCVYNISTRSRFLGGGADGFIFQNTSNFQDDQTRCGNGPTDVGGYLGEFVLALNTTGRMDISVNWLNEIVLQGDGAPLPRELAMRLQYRVGTSSAWADVPGVTEFNSAGQVDGYTQNYSVTLPASCNDQAEVQVRWKYHMIAANDGGTRARIRLDEISVSSTVTGMEELANGYFSVYPNPANGNEIFFNKKINATLVSVSGQIISEIKNAEKLDIREVSDGLYFLKTTTGHAVKVMVKK